MAPHHNLFSHSLILHKAPNPDQTSCYLSSKYLYGQRAVGTNFHLYHIYNFFFLLASRIARRRRWHPTPVLLPGKSHGWRSLVGCSPWGCWESDMTERLHFHFHALEKEMATHSSALAWRIPGTGKPGGLPSMGSHRVRHD